MRIQLMVLISSFLLLVSCSSAGETGRNSVSPTQTASSTNHEIASLPNTVGDISKIVQTPMLDYEQAVQAAAEEYEQPTGKWLGSGDIESREQLLTSHSSQVQEPGSSVGAGLERIPEGYSVRFQVTSRNAEGKRMSLLDEYIAESRNLINQRADYNYKLPNKPDCHYLMSVEVLSHEGNVEDTLLVPLYVPKNVINASLTVDDNNNGKPGAELKLYNAGPTSLSLGYGYSLYRQTDTGWENITQEGEVIAIGIETSPGDTFQETIHLPADLKPGTYRVVKSFAGAYTGLEATLAAEFHLN